MPFQVYYLRAYKLGQDVDLFLLQLSLAESVGVECGQRALQVFDLLAHRHEQVPAGSVYDRHSFRSTSVRRVRLNNGQRLGIASRQRQETPAPPRMLRDRPLDDHQRCVLKEFFILMVNVAIDRRLCGAGKDANIRLDIINLLAAATVLAGEKQVRLHSPPHPHKQPNTHCVLLFSLAPLLLPFYPFDQHTLCVCVCVCVCVCDLEFGFAAIADF